MNQAFSKKHSTTQNSKTATYEGMYDDGLPNQKLFDHHVNLAKGNVGLTPISYALCLLMEGLF
jgi:hypothetical protein